MSLKKIINIMLIGFLVFSNLSLSPAFAEEKEENELGNKEVTLYIPDLEENLIIYENKELTEELAHIENNSPALLLEDSEETSSSLVEIEIEEEKLTGYVQTEAIVEQEEEELLEYKLYTEKAEDTIQMYSDEILEDELYELADGTSVLVNESDLEVAIEDDKKSIFVTFNPETEIIPEELVDELKENENIQGFVEIKHLVSLEDEESFLKIRKLESEKEETTQEEQAKDEGVEKEETNKSENADELGKEIPKAAEKSESEVVEKKESKPTMFRSSIQETQTSLLAHINSGNGKIYKTLGETSFEAGETHTNKVYYVKKQAIYENELYYLLSLNSKATNNLGWMKASDVKVQKHTFINRSADKLSIKGNGKGTRMAWGGKKDTIHTSMSPYKGEVLHINMEEMVGTTTLYRGKINGSGANVWLSANQVEPIQIEETQTSLLAHINSGTGKIYKTLGETSFEAGETYTNKVYYVKNKQHMGTNFTTYLA